MVGKVWLALVIRDGHDNTSDGISIPPIYPECKMGVMNAGHHVRLV